MNRSMHFFAGNPLAFSTGSAPAKKRRNTTAYIARNFLILPFIIMVASWQTAQAQSVLDSRISIQSDNISLSELLRQIKDKTAINFIYNAEEVAEAKKISVNIVNDIVKNVLDKYLVAAKFRYETSGNNILIIKALPKTEYNGAVASDRADNAILIKGKITNEKGEVLAGVSVQEKESGATVVSSDDGLYAIQAPGKKSTLVFSYIGYESVEESVNNRRSIQVRLHQQINKDLEKVVVTGYGTQRKRDLTGAVSSIGAEKLTDRPVQSFEQALIGKTSGVKVSIPNGVLNNPPAVRIRGTNSISLSSSPLYVVDGIPINTGQVSPETNISNNPLSDINPSDIESVDILKDAASASIYGSRAAAGVIIITTRKGKAGKPRVNYNGWVSFASAVRLPQLLNAEQFMLVKNEAVLNLKNLSGNADNSNVPAASFFPTYRADGSLVDTRWYDVTYRTGVSHNHNIDFSGGSDATKYFFSANYSDQNGFVKKDEFKRIGIRFNIEHRVTNWLKISGGANYSRTNNLSPNTGSLPRNALLLTGIGRLTTATAPNVDPLNEDGSYNVKGNAMGMGANTVASNLYNPLALLDLNRYSSQSDHIISNINAEINIVRGLYFKTTYGIDYNKVENNAFESPIHGPGYPLRGAATNVMVNINNWNWTNTLNYYKGLGRHNFTFLAGYDVQKFSQNQWGAVRSSVADQFYTNFEGSYGVMSPIGNYALGSVYNNQWGYLSVFSRISYDFSKKYFFTVNFRRDGNSALGQDKKYGNFGGASVGWILSEENFYRGSSFSNFLNNIKLRASWGRVGNGNINNRYAALNLYNSGLYGDAATLNYYQAGNPSLGWETSNQTNIGADFIFLRDRLQIQLSYFNNDVNGLILNSPQTASKGIPGNSIALNVGSLYNRGVEIGLNANIINAKKFSWDASINYTAIKNRVTALAEGNIPVIGVTHTANETNNITKVGYSVGSLYGAKTDGVNPENGRLIFINRNGQRVQYSYAVTPGQSNWTYLDGSVAPSISSEDYYILGNALPTWYGGFSNNIKYSNIDLNINFSYSGGNYIQNGTRATLLDGRFYNNSTEVLERWTQPGQQTSVPRQVYGDVISAGNSFPISANVQKADFLRLESISLGYTLPVKIFKSSGINSLRIYAAVFNAFIITGYTGYDPEISSNGDSNIAPSIDRNSVPQARNYTAGINLAF